MERVLGARGRPAAGVTGPREASLEEGPACEVQGVQTSLEARADQILIQGMNRKERGHSKLSRTKGFRHLPPRMPDAQRSP